MNHLLTNKRAEYKNQILKLEPYKMILFSTITDAEYLNLKVKVLQNTKANQKQVPGLNWIVRTNNKVHAKLVIGKNGIYIGSYNLSSNSTSNMHEIGYIIQRESDPISCNEAEDYFDQLWGVSKSV